MSINIIEKIKSLTEELKHYAWAYYQNDAPEITDAEYDAKCDELRSLEDKENFWLADSPTRKVQGTLLDSLKKVKHPVPMLSADKSTDIADVIKFAGNKEITISYKDDGATLVLHYNNGELVQAVTRGDGEYGEDVTHTAKMIKNIPMHISYTGEIIVRGEAVIPWDKYREMNVDGTLGHPRNLSGGGLRQLDSKEAAKRNIYFYAFNLVNWKDTGVTTHATAMKFLEIMGIPVVPYAVLDDYDADSIKYLTEMDFNRERYNIPTDGWVFQFNDLAYGESLGITAHHPRNLYALKPETTTYKTIFRGVEFNPTRTGLISLTGLFDSVDIDETIVSRATLHNVSYFKDLELGIGDEIEVAKMNEIIPAILKNNTRSNTYKLIENCPCCGSNLVLNQAESGTETLICPNENCAAKQLAQFVHFVSKPCANIDGLSEAILSKFIDLGFIKTFADIYHLSDHKDEIIKLDGFGEKSYKKLYEAIELSREIKLSNFITALGIPLIGKTAGKTISKAFNGNYGFFQDAWEHGFDFSTFDDFGKAMADAMNDAWVNPNPLWAGLDKEFSFIVEEAPKISADDFISGKTFVVTGSFNNYKRSELEQIITNRGGKLSGSVSAKTSFLLTNDGDSGSSKAEKAKKLNIPIMSEDDFIKKAGL